MMAKAALAVGNVYYKQNELDSAIEAFKDALNIDPTTPAGYLGMGRVLLKQKKYPQAKEQVQKALVFNPQLTPGRLLMSQIYQEQGNTKAAIDEIESALRMNPTAWSAYQSLGNIYLKQKQYNLARKNFEDAQQLNPKIPVVAKMGYIEALIESNALNEASEILRELPNKKPIEAKKQKLWGDLYTRQGFTKEAAEAYRAANLLAAEQGEVASELSTLDMLIEEDDDKLG
jgi:tetratricopeptide (TPR) repeat protein